jgi:hypothetical protein
MYRVRNENAAGSSVGRIVVEPFGRRSDHSRQRKETSIMDDHEVNDGNAAQVAGLLVLPKQQRFLELAKAFAQAHGHAQTESGRIVAEGRVVAHGWSGYARRHRPEILDWIVAEVSAYGSFESLLDASDGYYPTMRIDVDWRMLPLADAYDAGQEDRADRRRAFRAMPAPEPIPEPEAEEAAQGPRP